MPHDVIEKALGDVIEVRERLAELGTDIRHLAHDIKNVLTALGNFVPRQEILEMRNASLEKHMATNARIDTLERQITLLNDAQTWFMRRIVGAVIVGIVGGGGVFTVFAYGITKLVAKQ